MSIDSDIDGILDVIVIKFRRELKELLLDYKKNLIKCEKGTAINNNMLDINYKQKLVNRIQKERTEAELLEIRFNAIDKRNRFFKKYVDIVKNKD